MFNKKDKVVKLLQKSCLFTIKKRVVQIKTKESQKLSVPKRQMLTNEAQEQLIQQTRFQYPQEE